MSLNPDQDFVEAGAEKVTGRDVDKVIRKRRDIEDKFKARGPLKRFIEDYRLLIALIKDYRAGKYRQSLFATIAAGVFALLYVFNPFDLVPDMLPIVGVLDDASVMTACLMLVERDLNKYRKWKLGQPDAA